MRFLSFLEMTFPLLNLLYKLVDSTSPTVSICQCPPQCQHVGSRARWMSVVTSCSSAAQRKVSPHRPTPGRSWMRCPGCHTTPCKVLQTSWPSEFPFAPPSLVNLTRIAELRLSNNPIISATCHVPGMWICEWECVNNVLVELARMVFVCCCFLMPKTNSAHLFQILFSTGLEQSAMAAFQFS